MFCKGKKCGSLSQGGSSSPKGQHRKDTGVREKENIEGW